MITKTELKSYWGNIFSSNLHKFSARVCDKMNGVKPIATFQQIEQSLVIILLHTMENIDYILYIIGKLSIYNMFNAIKWNLIKAFCS